MMEIWASIDIMKGRAVSLVRGNPTRSRIWGVSPLEAARSWEREGASGIHVVDLDRTLESGSNEQVVHSVVENSGIPVEVGGGIRDWDGASKWIDLGAARIVLGTIAFTDPDRLAQMVNRLGPNKVAAAVDFRKGSVVTNGWRLPRNVTPFEALREVRRLGVTTAVVTAVDRDGTATGPDTSAYRKMVSETDLDILASGGISSISDVRRLKDLGVHGIILGRALYEGTIQLTKAMSV